MTAGSVLNRLHPRWGFVITGLLAAAGTGLAAIGLLHWAPFAPLLGLARGIGGGANGIIWTHYFGLPMLGRNKGPVHALGQRRLDRRLLRSACKLLMQDTER